MNNYMKDRSAVTGLMINFFHVLLKATWNHADTFSLIIIALTNFQIYQDFQINLWRCCLWIPILETDSLKNEKAYFLAYAEQNLLQKLLISMIKERAFASF